MHNMHTSILPLEKHFDSCNNDLNTIAQTLESSFEQSSIYRRNPAHIIRRIKALVDELPLVQEEWRSIMIAKHDLIEAGKLVQIPTCQTLKHMSNLTQVPSSPDIEVVIDNFQKLAQECGKENADIISNAQHRGGMLSSKDLAVEVLNTLSFAPECKHDSDQFLPTPLAPHDQGILTLFLTVLVHPQVPYTNF